MENQEAHNDQPVHVIERSGGPLPLYLDEKLGRDYASPFNGWTVEKDNATVYTEAKAQALLDGPLQLLAPHCKVVAK